ncbi:unnamed protein product, partial [Brenthis ino]
MDDEISPDVIKATQISLGKYIKRPPLSDKLLKKPPFRFLHDIITSVLKNTGFFNGLFEEEELISDKVKDRDSKILFLNKVITVIVSTTGKSLTVKPSKIVAGQEPEKTNELLQCLAFALDNKLSSDEAVKLYKESIKSNKSVENKTKDPVIKSVKKTTETKKLTSRSSEKLAKNDKSNNSIKSKQKQVNNIRKESPTKKVSQLSKPINNQSLNKEKQDIKNDTQKKVVNINKEPVLNSEKSVVTEPIIDNSKNDYAEADDSPTAFTVNDPEKHIEDTKNIDDRSDPYIEDNKSPVKKPETLIPEPIDNIENIISTNKEDIVVNNNLDQSDIQDHQKSPTSKNEDEKLPSNNEKIVSHGNDIQPLQPTQPLQTKVKELVNVVWPQSVRPSSSRPSAPRLKEKHESLLSTADNLAVGKVNIIAENTTQEEEEDSSIIVVETTEPETKSQDQEELLSSNQHGHLVQQILDAQKEFSEVAGKTNIEWQFGVQRSRDVVNQEIEQLRFNVQALSRVANPLGKLLDHVQEDAEVMRQELQQWTIAYEEASKHLLKQKAANEESLLPLQTKIKQLQVDIEEKHDKINDLKIIINKNTFRIEKLLASGNMQ